MCLPARIAWKKVKPSRVVLPFQKAPNCLFSLHQSFILTFVYRFTDDAIPPRSPWTLKRDQRPGDASGWSQMCGELRGLGIAAVILIKPGRDLGV